MFSTSPRPYRSCSPLVCGMDTDIVQLGDIKNVHEQANYTNAILNAITEQLDQLDAETNSKKGSCQKGCGKPQYKTLFFFYRKHF